MKSRTWFLSANKQLQQGITNHSLKDVEEALARGADVKKIYKVADKEFSWDNKYCLKLTPLIHALMQSDIEIISALLKTASIKKITTKTHKRHKDYDPWTGVPHTESSHYYEDYSPLTIVFNGNKINYIDIFRLL